jgi:uncharacterized protein
MRADAPPSEVLNHRSVHRAERDGSDKRKEHGPILSRMGGAAKVHSLSQMKREDLLDLNDVLQHPGRTLAVEISSDMEFVEDIDLIAPLEGTMEALSTGNLLLVTGEFSTRAILECVRCGTPVEVPIEFEIDEQFKVEGTPSSYSSQDMAKVVDDEPYPLFEDNSLMVEELLRQDLLLALPPHPTCPEGTETCREVDQQIAKLNQEEGRPEFQNLSRLLGPDG